MKSILFVFLKFSTSRQFEMELTVLAPDPPPPLTVGVGGLGYEEGGGTVSSKEQTLSLDFVLTVQDVPAGLCPLLHVNTVNVL